MLRHSFSSVFRLFWLVTLFSAVLLEQTNGQISKSSPSGVQNEKTFPSHISKYDLMTDADAFYTRYLDPATQGDVVADWPLVKQIVKLGVRMVDADTIAAHLNEAFPAEGQKAFKDVQTIVDECSQTLGVKPPMLWIKQDGNMNAYVTKLSEPHFLVLTSALYERYKTRPDELRFIVGHEIGHIKCGHIRCHTVGRQLVNFILGDTSNHGFKENYVAPLLIGQLLRWSRESEMSADRAGLLCVGSKPGDTKVAKAALNRLLHGTGEDVDPRPAELKVIEFEKDPFVKIFRKLRAYNATHPFIPDRRNALDQWVLSTEYAQLIERPKEERSERSLVIDEIAVKQLPDTDTGFGDAVKCDPIITVVYSEREEQSSMYTNESNPALSDLGWTFPYVPNCRLIIEVVDYNSVLPNKFVGSCILPVNPRSSETKGELRLDVKEPNSKVSLPQVVVKYRLQAKE